MMAMAIGKYCFRMHCIVVAVLIPSVGVVGAGVELVVGGLVVELHDFHLGQLFSGFQVDQAPDLHLKKYFLTFFFLARQSISMRILTYLFGKSLLICQNGQSGLVGQGVQCGQKLD